MGYLFAGTLIVWISILGYVVTISIRQKKLFKQIDHLERNGG